MNNIEEFRDIPGYEGIYQISNFGLVKSLSRIKLNRGIYPQRIKEKILIQTLNSSSYLAVTLCRNGKDSLILSARIENEPIETIEISLSKLEILQIRGYSNQPTEYHDEILKLMKSSLPKIGRLIKKHQKEISNKKAA